MVKTPNIVPNGINKHSIHAITKLYMYFIFLDKNLPDNIVQIEIANPIAQTIAPIMAKSHPTNAGGCSPPLSIKLSGDRIINNPIPT